jgi:hypothetical protein
MTPAPDRVLWIVAFALLGLILGGAAAVSTGRALALGWRSFAIAPFYMVVLSAAVGFLHYALFGLSAIPLYDIGAALWSFGADPSMAIARLAADCAYWAALAVLLTGFAFLGFRVTRTAQMAHRYGWIFERTGFFAWQDRPPS